MAAGVTDCGRAALLLATSENTEKYILAGRFIGRVIDAYDGDTCRIALAFPSAGGPDVKYITVRMLGYDSPEVRKLTHRPYGLEVTAVFHALVLGRTVVVDIPRPDKADPYGRTLANLYASVRPNRDDDEAPCAVIDVRGRSVTVPRTYDAIAEEIDDYDGLLHVNGWMLANARVKYCGGSRDGYTAEELKSGV